MKNIIFIVVVLAGCTSEVTISGEGDMKRVNSHDLSQRLDQRRETMDQKMGIDASTDLKTPEKDMKKDIGQDLGDEKDTFTPPTCKFPPSSKWSGELAQPKGSAPGFKESVIEPSFGTTITKITQGSYQHYSKTQPWNSEGTMFFTDRGGREIIDGNNYEILTKGNMPTGERRWSTVDPDKMFHVEGTKFSVYNPRTDKNSLVHDFSNEGCDLIRLGPWEGNLSIGDKRVAFACQRGSDLRIIVYEIDKDSILASRDFQGKWGDDKFDWVSVSQSGEYVVIMWADGVGVISYHAKNLTEIKTLTPDGGHGDLCVDEKGAEVFVQVICGGHPDRGVAGVMSYNLDSGKKTIIIPSDNFVCVGHISCRNYRRPGWVYVSADHHSEAFAAKLDGSLTVQHFAHTHQSYNKAKYHGMETLAVPSPDGCSVMWGSDWSGSSAAYVSSQK